MWDGNVPLHEWQYEGSVVPCGKLVGEEKYSIVSDYLGTPSHVYDSSGSLVWERELDVYAPLRKGNHDFVPFLYQGQYVDVETGLAYNRFRYYDPESGNFISQDPIGLLGNNPNLYAYVFDSNKQIDVFGLDCFSDARKLRNNMRREGINEPNYKNSAHHIIMFNSKDPRMVALQEKMKQLGLDINDAVNGVYLPISTKVKDAAGASAHAHSRVHTNNYKQNVFNRLKDINNKSDFENVLMDIGDELMSGTFEI
ncbi:hypothetical protein GNY06_04430 [Elizabethkingia argentiflava]|uniref:Teneurin-like YD-shell domain-containing protein n=1 Tax=Elizabethkingia argenteiflava TaxID=2681556 RepID=A0A845PUG5_9FLAO|nr:RHS repeat-associated core domain-containing protein [Elizabethkingia argenteiflava]NAW50661.1 hypothetical protein [Elizabethkingia argenteiflava]